VKRVVWDRPAEVARWVCERVGGSYDPGSMTALGLERDGVLIAGVMFDHYNGRSVAMHVAGDGGHWMTREFARACFGYAFNQLRVGKVLGFVDSTNTAARRYDEHLGFVLEATITGAGKTGDLLIYSMTPQQCRWIGA
jgi:RimJ/RimL family protein N-acetyltransferase